MTPSIFRFVIASCVSLGVMASSASVFPAQPSCDKWTASDFFKDADVATVSRCLKTKNTNTRDESGRTPLHLAAGKSKNPAVITALLKAGADTKVRTFKDEYGGGRTPLHDAASWNENPAVITALLKAGADIKVRTFRSDYGGGETPLHFAAQWNENPAVVTALIKAGADPNARDHEGETPLHDAAWRNNNPAVVTALIKAGADPNARDHEGETPLHGAARRNNNPAVVTALIKAGADPNARDHEGETPLHHAAWRFAPLEGGPDRSPQVVVALVKGGADPNARTPIEKDESAKLFAYSGGDTPLHNAVTYERPALITALVAMGADPTVRNESGESPLEEAQRKKPALLPAFKERAVAAFREAQERAEAATRRRQAEERAQAARVACDRWNSREFFRHAEAADVSRCLKTNDPNARDDKGWSPLHLAAMFSKEPTVVATLAKGGAEPNARDGEDRTPLHLAAVFGESPAIVTALIKAGADADALDGKGRTPLQLAEKFSEMPAVVSALKKARDAPVAAAGAPSQVLCENWNTASFYRDASLDELSRCLETEDPDARNENGRTPLHFAAQGRRPVFVTALAKAGAQVNARDERGGWTPLHLAAWFGQSKTVVEALLEAGADPEVTDDAGKTPWDYLTENPVLKEFDPQLAKPVAKAVDPLQAQVSCEDWNTPLFFERAGWAEVFRCLTAGRKIEARDVSGATPLHLAGRHAKAAAVVVALVEAGARLAARDETGATPLHAAAAKSAVPEVLRALLDAGADTEAKDETGKTPWDYLKENPTLSGTDLNRLLAKVSCEDWNTPLFFEHARAEDVSDCLTAGAQASEQDESGLTPLHLAAAKSAVPSVVRTLLDAGANPAAKDKQGKAPWDYAKTNTALKGSEVYWQLNEGRFK